jgi:uncharacterized protein YndB with AHSA1/START domain
VTASGSSAPAAVVRQRLPAPPDVVYEEWTDADRLSEWMCPRPARCLSVIADPRIGGVVRLEIEDAGVRFTVSGNYVTLDRPHRVAFTWSCSTWPDPTVQSLVTVTIAPDGPGASMLTIEHTVLPSGLADQHARGWARVGEQLAASLRGRASGPDGPVRPNWHERLDA